MPNSILVLKYILPESSLPMVSNRDDFLFLNSLAL